MNNIFHNLAYKDKRVVLGAKYAILESQTRQLELVDNPRILAMPGKEGFEEVMLRSLSLEPRRLHTIEREKIIYEYHRSQGYTTTKQACQFEDAIPEICKRPIQYDFVHFDFPSMLTETLRDSIEMFLSKDMLKEDSLLLLTTVAHRTTRKAAEENRELAGGSYKFPPTHHFLTQMLSKLNLKSRVLPIPYTTEVNYSATTCVFGLGRYNNTQRS